MYRFASTCAMAGASSNVSLFSVSCNTASVKERCSAVSPLLSQLMSEAPATSRTIDQINAQVTKVVLYVLYMYWRMYVQVFLGRIAVPYDIKGQFRTKRIGLLYIWTCLGAFDCKLPRLTR